MLDGSHVYPKGVGNGSVVHLTIVVNQGHDHAHLTTASVNDISDNSVYVLFIMSNSTLVITLFLLPSNNILHLCNLKSKIDEYILNI